MSCEDNLASYIPGMGQVVWKHNFLTLLFGMQREDSVRNRCDHSLLNREITKGLKFCDQSVNISFMF